MTKAGERELIKVENVNGGAGFITKEPLVSSEEVGEACKMYAKVSLLPGSEIGYHEHHGETESYFILTGTGLYDDNGTECPAEPGDLFLCKDGAGHGIKNTGTEELSFMALILKK
ncbi:MAG: cupin domain-containing protein [Dorea sp.]|nr:cupin domain-containing protein [Dorea sp.]